MSGNPVLRQRIFIGVEGPELSRVAESVRGLKVKMKKCSWMLLCGLMLMNVQKRRF